MNTRTSLDFGEGVAFKASKTAGFTLAEVLITLGIIGVVAAMTIPNLIANTNGAKVRINEYKNRESFFSLFLYLL